MSYSNIYKVYFAQAPRLSAIDVHMGVRISEARVAQQMTQHELAELVGISPEQVAAIELGHERAAADLLFQIADGLDVPLAFLFKGLKG